MSGRGIDPFAPSGFPFGEGTSSSATTNVTAPTTAPEVLTSSQKRRMPQRVRYSSHSSDLDEVVEAEDLTPDSLATVLGIPSHYRVQPPSGFYVTNRNEWLGQAIYMATFPKPISVNNIWKSHPRIPGKMYRDRQYTDWINHSIAIVQAGRDRRAAGVEFPLDRDQGVTLTLRVYFADGHGDVSNTIKAAEDLLWNPEVGVLLDDNQVVKVVAERELDENDPRVELVLTLNDKKWKKGQLKK